MKSRRKKFTTMHAKKRKSASLGSGGRFAALKARLAARPGKDKVLFKF